MTVSEAWDFMRAWMSFYVNGNPAFLILAGAAFVYLMIVNRNVRKGMLWPILLMVPVVINPVLYKYVYKDLRYWRFFWLLPEAVLIALAVADLGRRVNKQWAKCLVLAAAATVLILTGQNVFSPEAGQFAAADNNRKVSREVRENCEIILADNPAPKCIFQDWIANETREFSGEITQLYGRDIDGYIIWPSEEAVRVKGWWDGTTEEQEGIFAFAEEDGYTHICCLSKEEYGEMAGKHGFVLLAEVNGRSIYKRNQ